MKEYYRKNKTKMNNTMRLWRSKNKEKQHQYAKQWLKEHKIYIQKYLHDRKNLTNLRRKEYYKSNINRFKVYRNNRRLQTKDLSLNIVQQVYEDNIKRFGTLTCYLCLKPTEFGNDTLEHKIPLIRGGNNEYSNLGIACDSCNSKKGRKTEEEFNAKIKAVNLQ